MELEERYMLMFLMDCENKFNKNNDWFYLTDDDFIDAGFGKDKVKLRKTRNSLVEKGLIAFNRGGFGKKSKYMVKI